MPENDVIKNKDLLGKEAQAIPVPEKEIGIDINDEFANLILNAATNSLLDINSIDGLSNVAQTREMLYTLIDTMGNDDAIASVLETYAEDVVDTNDDGRVVWCESDDAEIAKYVNLLLDELNVDKNMYKWVYALIKYGDLYLKLFRQDEYGEDVLFKTDEKEEIKDRRLNESKETDDIESKEKLDESVKFHINTNNDPYATYVEAIANPGEMFELTRFGKTMGYIQAPVTVQQVVNQDSMLNQYINYKMKKKDVNVYGAQDFVHAALRDDVERAPEEIDIFNTDEDFENGTHGGKYRVRRGQSILASSFKVWRELTLLENSMLMNRLTRSAIVRILSMDVGEMPQNKVRDVLGRLKSLLEQKTAYKKDGGISEYTNPGPMENIILLPSHGTQGVVNSQTLGGDVNIKDIVDVDYFQDKLYGALRVPKQYFGKTDDSTGFNGGTALTILSSRYGKSIKRIQNTMCTLITDLVNLFLINRGLDNHVNNFTIKMQPPITQEELDRRENMRNRMGVNNDIMSQVSTYVKDDLINVKVLKNLLSNTISDPEVINLIQEYIDELEAKKEEKPEEETDNENETPITSEEPFGEEPPRPTPMERGLEGPEFGGEETPEETPEEGEEGGESYLPSADEMGIDLTSGEF